MELDLNVSQARLSTSVLFLEHVSKSPSGHGSWLLSVVGVSSIPIKRFLTMVLQEPGPSWSPQRPALCLPQTTFIAASPAIDQGQNPNVSLKTGSNSVCLSLSAGTGLRVENWTSTRIILPPMPHACFEFCLPIDRPMCWSISV